MITRERIIEELETVMDPEIGVDLWTLGLIYGIEFEDEKYIKITMTYTTPVCPYGPALKQEVMDAMHDLGFRAVEIDISFDPPWKPPQNLRAMLGV